MGDQDIHHGHGGGRLHEEMLEEALRYMNSFGSFVLLFGVATALVNFSLLLVQHVTGRPFHVVLAVTQKHRSPLTLDRIKLELTQMVSFSLLLLVAVDVLETLLKPGHEFAMEELYKMVLIGSIRTTLAYFLGKETEEILHHIAHSSENDEHGHVNPEEEPKLIVNESKPTVQKQEKNHNSGGKNKKKQKKS